MMAAIPISRGGLMVLLGRKVAPRPFPCQL
jgi:hypothetical protein